MKNKLFYILWLAMLVVQACSTKDVAIFQNPSLPTVTIEQVGESSTNDLVLRFTTSSNAVGFRYALCGIQDSAAFLSGTLEGIEDIAVSGEKEITLNDLYPGTIYSISAVAYDDEGELGPLSVSSFFTLEEVGQHHLKASVNFLTSTSVSFMIEPENHWGKFEYALGTASDKAAFENGTLETVVVDQMDKFFVPFFELEPSSDHVFYIRAWDRTGAASEIVEVPVTMEGTDATPQISMSISSQNIYEGNYSFSPNSLCGKFGVIICHKGGMDADIFNRYTFNGDIVALFESYMDMPEWSNPLGVSEDGSSVDLQYFTPEFVTDTPLEAYAILYDKDGNVSGAQRISFTAPAYNPALGTAKVTSMEFTDIAEWYSPFSMSVNEHTLLTFFSYFTEEEYQEALAGAEQSSDPYYIHKLAIEKAYDSYLEQYIFFYGESTYNASFNGTVGEYILAAVPVNGNGIENGLGELFTMKISVPAQ